MTAVPQQPSSPQLVFSGFAAASSTTPLPSWSFSSSDDEEMGVLVAKMRSQC
uniref:Uncharacterized protein n=1 Tax=Kalanchoe fedtschenkoi TaxID=63787 RepID=A0A7N0T220_KALFE